MSYVDIVRLNRLLCETTRFAALAQALAEQTVEAARKADDTARIAKTIIDNIRPS